ncbi:MAG: hypothetical protein OHK0040_06820 [bacterium]
MEIFKKSFFTYLFLLILLIPRHLYAFDPLEKLKSIKESAAELGEALLLKGKKLPKAIAVLPATGEGEEQDKVEIRTTFSNHISYKNYEQLKLTDVDTKLFLAKKEKGVEWDKLTPQELGKALNVDGLIYVHIVGIEKVYAALYASLTLKLKVKLVNAENGETIWEKEDSVTERSGGVPTTPWGAISTAVSSALVLRESVKVALTDKLCRSLAKEMPEPKSAKGKKPPAIYSVLTNALDSPFKAQDEILVSVQGEEGQTAYFDIGDAKKAIQLTELKPGEYVGKYVVTEGDGWKNKTITAYLYSSKDRLEAKYIVPHAVTVDTVPPDPVRDVKFSLQKDGLHISWTPPSNDDLKDYVIQRATVDAPDFVEVATLSVPEFKDSDITFGKKYYYRIFARDNAKNLSKFTEVSRVIVKQGPTLVTGDIKENTIFYAAGSPYILKGDVEVTKGATLSIEEGAILEFERDAKLVVSGKMHIAGKKDATITVKGADYSIILRDTAKDALLADYAYFLGGRRFVITNGFASFNNVTFEDFNIALILERNSNVQLKDVVFRKNKLGIKISDSTLTLQNVELEGTDKALEIAGSAKLLTKDVRCKKNNIHILSEGTVEFEELEVSDDKELDVIRKIKGKVEIKKLKPFGKSFSNIKKGFLDDLKREFSIALVRNNMDEAYKKAKLLEELSEQDFYELSDSMAYVYYLKGNTEKVKEILKKGQAKSQKEIENIIKLGDKSGIYMMFVDVKVALGSSLDGVDRAAITKAKWRAVKSFSEEKIVNMDRDRISVLNDKVIPKSSDYVINVVPLFTQTGDISYDGYFLIILDSNKLLSDLKELRLLGDVKRETKLAIVDCSGLGLSKGLIIKTLNRLNFIFAEYGTGSCEPSNYYDKAKNGDIDLLLTVFENAKVSPSLLGGNLKNIQANVEVKGYDVFLSKPIFNITKGTNIYHMNEEAGKEIAIKNAFDAMTERFEREILTIEKQFSADEHHKKAKKAHFAEKYLPPIEIKVEKSEAIFANNYKVYAEKPFIEITVSNNTASNLEALKVAFMIKDYMDFPSETRIDRLDALSSKKIKLTAVFNNKLLDLTENSMLQSDLSVKFVKDGVEKNVSLTHPVQVYEKHALLWDDRAKIAIYITPKDPAVVDFSREVSRSVKEKIFSTNFSLGMAVFEALRSIGIVYQQDPNNPYQVVSEKAETVDYVQYAKETLKRRAGDCDDLVSLFVSLVESLGIKAAAVDYPGHIFAMFDSGILKEEIEKFGLKREQVVIYEDTVYIPVELTLLGENFYNAWLKGAANYNENLGKGLKIVMMEKAWQNYKPATLPQENINVKLPANFESFYRSSYDYVAEKRNEEVLKNIKANIVKPEQTIFTAYRSSNAKDAIMLGEFLVKSGFDEPLLCNDLANIYFLDKKYDEAVAYYKKAAQKDAENPFYLVNLLRTYKKMGRKNDAKVITEKLRKIAPFLLEE